MLTDPANVPLRVAVAHPEKVGHPDGVPHDVIGIAAYFSVMIAAITAISWMSVGPWLAIPLAIIGILLLTRGLVKRARRERKEEAIAAALHLDDAP